MVCFGTVSDPPPRVVTRLASRVPVLVVLQKKSPETCLTC